MKKYVFILLATVLVACTSSCSKDDSESNESSNYLVGVWKAQNDLYGIINGGTWYTVMEFRKDGTFSNYYQKSDGTIQMRTDNNHYVITSETMFTTYKSDKTKIGDFICDKSSFKPKDWNSSSTLYYFTFWKQ